MSKLRSYLKNQKGAVTIEATIALTSFLFMFIMIYSLVTICRAQAIIQVAINSTAKELSQYSYVYSITGLHDSMTNLQNSANETKQDVNQLAGDIADVFSGIQSLGDSGKEIDGVQGIMDSWDTISTTLQDEKASLLAVQDDIERMAEDPQKMLFGMGKLFASEVYETAKSFAAEAVSRILTQKHLKRRENDTAETFCKSVGIVPGTYFGKMSYFNGIDFSRSTIFPYGSDEITIVANYKVKILQLLPVPIELHFTQTAVTKGWFQGDGTATTTTPEEQEKKLREKGDSIWNSMEKSEREKFIRKLAINTLKDEDGYSSVSGETYIHLYDKDTNTFAMIRSYNPLDYVTDPKDVDEAKVKEYLENLRGQMLSTTDNKVTIKIKAPDNNGNLKTSEVNCQGVSTKKIYVVIPEDEELKQIFTNAMSNMNTSGVEFEIMQNHGKVFKEETEVTSGGNEE